MTQESHGFMQHRPITHTQTHLNLLHSQRPGRVYVEGSFLSLLLLRNPPSLPFLLESQAQRCPYPLPLPSPCSGGHVTSTLRSRSLRRWDSQGQAACWRQLLFQRSQHHCFPWPCRKECRQHSEVFGGEVCYSSGPLGGSAAPPETEHGSTLGKACSWKGHVFERSAAAL